MAVFTCFFMYRTYSERLVGTTALGDDRVVQIIPKIPRTCSPSIYQQNIFPEILNITEKLQLSQLAIRLVNGRILQRESARRPTKLT